MLVSGRVTPLNFTRLLLFFGGGPCGSQTRGFLFHSDLTGGHRFKTLPCLVTLKVVGREKTTAISCSCFGMPWTKHDIYDVPFLSWIGGSSKIRKSFKALHILMIKLWREVVYQHKLKITTLLHLIKQQLHTVNNYLRWWYMMILLSSYSYVVEKHVIATFFQEVRKPTHVVKSPRYDIFKQGIHHGPLKIWLFRISCRPRP